MRKGSTTVEAALLMPLLLSVLLLLIYVSVFLYNRQAVTVIAGSAVIKGAQMEHEGKKQIQKQTEEYVRSQCEDMLVFDAHTEYTITVSTTKIHVLLKIQQDIPFGNMLKQFGWGDKLSFQTEKTALRLDPAAFIREIRRVDQLSGKVGK